MPGAARALPPETHVPAITPSLQMRKPRHRGHAARRGGARSSTWNTGQAGPAGPREQGHLNERGAGGTMTSLSGPHDPTVTLAPPPAPLTGVCPITVLIRVPKPQVGSITLD